MSSLWLLLLGVVAVPVCLLLFLRERPPRSLVVTISVMGGLVSAVAFLGLPKASR